MDQPIHQLSMTVLMTPDTANFSGNVHGGTILKLLDQVAFACASRYAGRYVVTLSVDQVVFRQPIQVGELVTFLSSDDVLADPQVQARNMMIEQDHPVLGKIRLPNLPFKFSECDTSPTCVAPSMGQHNRAIATSLGYSAIDIDAMEHDGVLYSPASEGAQS